MSARRLPEATVSRLPVYLRVLTDSTEETISSDHLAARAGVNAAQVRKDLSHLGSYGTRGVGYEVAYLVRQINRELGLTTDRRVAIVGVGNLGHALLRYRGFAERGFRIVAAFDVDPRTVGQRVGALVVQPMSELADAIEGKGLDIALLTTPASVAQDVTDALVAAGIHSILNFAPVRLEAAADVAVRQVDLGVELQILSYYGSQISPTTEELEAEALPPRLAVALEARREAPTNGSADGDSVSLRATPADPAAAAGT